MRGITPLVVRLLLLILLPCIIAYGFFTYHFHKSLPLTSGSVPSNNISSNVTISRDSMGVPVIVSKEDEDAFYAVGYAHAQDRLWQLEVQKRLISGRLSEVFGKRSVSMDAFFRTLNLKFRAQEDLSLLSEQAQMALSAYSNGINDFIANVDTLPIEFRLLGIKPTPWEPADSLAWVKAFALNLGGNYRDEINRLVISQYLSQQQIAQLLPNYPVDGYTSIAQHTIDTQTLDHVSALNHQLEAELNIGGKFVGSNAWAVAPLHSKSGGALLATDPHLGLQSPSPWYMATIKGDNIHASGATLVGLPVIVFGKNEHIAWSATNLMADVQDLFFEQVKADDKTKYLHQGQWLSFKERTEYIEVRQDFPEFIHGALKPVKVKVRESVNGPIINDILNATDSPASLSWTALHKNDTSFESLLKLNYAQNRTEFSRALDLLVAPALNFLYADYKGNIGYRVAGKIPIRSGWDGLLPVPGWQKAYRWTGYIPGPALPSTFNPASGYLVSANNKPTDDTYPHFISHDFAPPTRSERISQLIQNTVASGQKIDLSDFESMQHDTYNNSAIRLLDVLLKQTPSNDQQRQAHRILSQWNGNMSAHSAAPTILNIWINKLRKALVRDELKESWNDVAEKQSLKYIAQNIHEDTLYTLLTSIHSAWCDDIATEYIESCSDIIDASLNDALWEVYKITGESDLSQWKWGTLHHAVYKHKPFSEVNFLKDYFTPQINSEGSPDSISVADYHYKKSSGYEQYFGATFKQLFDMGQHQQHLFMLAPGQSGNIASDHYDDLLEPFHSAVYQNMPSAETSDFEVLTLISTKQQTEG
ncbi:penicillin acylase family protein [Pseudoalteromonas sp. SMS1]|uniref:penicillin acylase family protein n=1 Tax=Pseudoalteromonas sp. SMS1 TaxID=2908894 RepID=UPI001F195E2E|nr:penicillin acylase family protein [Pseudoalteromonas sp. SMS1]MCF2859832.1 penicillin acylase family protein [Pseudoalteromonas sp. SMS1]